MRQDHPLPPPDSPVSAARPPSAFFNPERLLMFQIEEITEARLVTLTSRSEKHGDDDVPAVSLGLEITVPNTMLDQIDPTLREALYKAIDDQEPLPGVERSTPILRCNSFE